MNERLKELRESYNEIIKMTENQISTINVDPNDENIADYLDHQKENFAAYQTIKKFSDSVMNEIEYLDKAMEDINRKLDVIIANQEDEIRASAKKVKKED